jgi:hypothetical protein
LSAAVSRMRFSMVDRSALLKFIGSPGCLGDQPAFRLIKAVSNNPILYSASVNN